MAKRPEGLSPCYFSLASPDIPDSHKFQWTPHTTQNGATIHIYASDSTTLLKTYAVSGNTTEVDMASIGYAFAIGTDYYWTVTVAGVVSVKAKFEYDSCPIAPSVTWSYIPKAGEVIVSDTYFAEMKTNLTSILSDYEGVSSSLYSQVQNLFDGEVVPSRKDFQTLEAVVDFLSKSLEKSYSVDIDGPVENSLGISDLEKIRKHLDMIMTVKPEPVQKLSIEVAEPTMYKVYGIDVKNDGKTDPTMDVTWSVENVPSYSGRFTFEEVSPSKDIRYYRAIFQYGPSNNPFSSELYFKESSIYNGATRTFDTDWDGLYTATTIGLAKQSLQVFAVDHRGNHSEPKTVNKTYGSNFKAPLGVKHYEVQVQRAALNDASADPNGAWYDSYSGSEKKHVRKITGGEGRIYFRVRAVDLSGLTTAWIYDNGITFDPLTKPPVPKNFRVFDTTTTSIGLDWDPSPTAERYEVKRWITPGTEIFDNTGTYCWDTGLSSASTYNYYVRAINRIGASDWAVVTGTTKTARKTSEKQATKGRSWRNNWGWDTSSNVHQGEWCEIAGSPNRVYSVPVGYCWGKWKGMWIFDDEYWRNTLAGKKIIKVELYIHRQGNAHGYYNDQVPTFWLHNYDNYPSGQPSFFGKHQPGKDFDLGEKAWVTLPNYYGEYIRDGKARGIGIYRDNWGKLPYIKYYQNAKLRITYE
jgi:hypothetical protein